MAMNKQRKTSNVLNILNYDDAGNIVIKDYGQVTRYSWNGSIHGFLGQLSVSSVSAAITDTDKFLVSDGGVLKYRTGAEVLSDIGGIGGSGESGQVSYWDGTNTQTGSNELFWDVGSASLGIGLINPQRKLEIYSATADNHLRLSGSAPSVSMGDAITGAIYQAKFGLATANGQYATAAMAGDFVILSQTGATIFMTSATERMRLTTAGRLLLGTTTENNSALFNIASTSQGFLPPRMATTQRDAIASPATGLQIYNTTTNANNYYNGSAWVAVGGGVTTLYTGDGTLAGDRIVTSNGNSLTILGGKEEISGFPSEQISLRLQGSTTAKNPYISLKNTNASGKDYALRSMVDGTFDIFNITNLGSVFKYDHTNNLTQFRASTNLTDLGFYLGSNASVLGLWLNGTRTIGSYAIIQNSGSTYLNTASGGTIGFRVNNAEKMTLTAAGRLLLGTTSEATYILDVNGTGRFKGLVVSDVNFPNVGIFRDVDVVVYGPAGQGIEFGARSGTSFITGATIYGGLDNPSTTGNLYFQTRTAGALTTKMFIDSNGYVGIGNILPGYNLDVTGTLHTTGQNKLDNLGGTGTRMVVADSTGILSTQAIPSGGVTDGDKGDITVSGSGATWTIDNSTIGIAKLSATGTASATTYLRGDNTWATIPVGGTVTSVATTGPITGGTITTSGTIGITQSGISTDGYLSSTDWNIFNGKMSSNVYTSNGTLSGDRTILDGGYSLLINPKTTFSTALTATGTTSTYSMLGQNVITYPVGFSSSNLGNTYGASGSISLQTFLGNATFSNANLAAAHAIVNSIKFSVASSTITMTQAVAPSIRAMAANIYQTQFDRSNSGTISHLAVNQNLGIYLSGGGSGVLTITNAYSLLINALDEYGTSGLTFSPNSRWAIYQVGQNDNNYFRAKVIIGTVNAPGQSPLRITGLPTSASGLSAGDVWNNGGVLNIV